MVTLLRQALRQAQDDAQDIAFAVVVPAYNEGELIGREERRMRLSLVSLSS